MRKFLPNLARGNSNSLPAPGAVLWLDGQDPVNGMQIEGGYLTSWTDKSGYGHNVAPTVPSVMTQNTHNGKKYASGFGPAPAGACGLAVTPAIPSGVFDATGYSHYAVVWVSGAPAVFDIIYSTYNSTGGDFAYLGRSVGNVIGAEGNLFGGDLSVVANQLANATPIVMSNRGIYAPIAGALKMLNTGDSLRTQGSFAHNPTGPSASATFVGTWQNGGVWYPLYGDLAELAVFPYGLSDAADADMLDFLNSEYL